MNPIVRSCVPLAVACSVPHAAPAPSEAQTRAALTARVESGQVAGVAGRDPAIAVFRGIPFAAPPVGERRWQPPERPLPWSGVRSAATFSKSCVQALRRSYLPWTEEYMLRNDVDEDCLALNIWAPVDTLGAHSPARPVFVFVHGGAFNSGSGEVALYDGERLAKQGIIVVTINYRLGVFGFFCHAELSQQSPHQSCGNYGLLDQIAALEWVKRNIAAFGGDAGNVTLGGQSAGAASVHYLTFSPLARGLFQRAIAQSGAWDSHQHVSERSQAEAEGAQFAAKAGKSLSELRALPAQALFDKYSELGMQFRPVVDGWVVPDQLPALLARAEYADVPLLTGLTADERSSQSNYGRLSLSDWTEAVRQEYGPAANALLAAYPATSDAQAAERQKQLWRDAGLAKLLDWRRLRAQHGRAKDYGYLFERAIPWPAHPEYQAFHSGELPYVFDNLALMDRPWAEQDRALARLASSYWVNFIRTGDPNGPGLPPWPSGCGQVMRLAAEARATVSPDADKARLLASVAPSK